MAARELFIAIRGCIRRRRSFAPFARAGRCFTEADGYTRWPYFFFRRPPFLISSLPPTYLPRWRRAFYPPPCERSNEEIQSCLLAFMPVDYCLNGACELVIDDTLQAPELARSSRVFNKQADNQSGPKQIRWGGEKKSECKQLKRSQRWPLTRVRVLLNALRACAPLLLSVRHHVLLTHLPGVARLPRHGSAGVKSKGQHKLKPPSPSPLLMINKRDTPCHRKWRCSALFELELSRWYCLRAPHFCSESTFQPNWISLISQLSFVFITKEAGYRLQAALELKLVYLRRAARTIEKQSVTPLFS